MIGYNKIGHKCFYCKKWICDTPEELECLGCKKKERYRVFRAIGPMLLITRCRNCEELISEEYTPEGSSV